MTSVTVDGGRCMVVVAIQSTDCHIYLCGTDALLCFTIEMRECMLLPSSSLLVENIILRVCFMSSFNCFIDDDND
jgi:hypothetical protein